MLPISIAGIILLWIGEYLDYYFTMKLENRGWLNASFERNGEVLTSREKTSFWMKNGIFLTNKFRIFKIAVVIVLTVVTLVVLAFSEQFAIAMFILDAIVGIYHGFLGLKNKKHYSEIQEFVKE